MNKRLFKVFSLITILALMHDGVADAKCRSNWWWFGHD